MLHAFNQKNVRRVLASAREEHVLNKDEDGVTSMVFSPLVFMTAPAAAAVLPEIVGGPLAGAFEARSPIRHDVRFWPSLRATSRSGVAWTRCEPDFLARFEFHQGPAVVVIGEMKWDMPVSAADLQQQTNRQRGAVARLDRNARVVRVSITKHRLAPLPSSLIDRTWVDVHRAASSLARTFPSSAEGRWGALVSEFLARAEQMEF